MVRATFHYLERDGDVRKERRDTVCAEVCASIEYQPIDARSRLSSFGEQRPQSAVAVGCPATDDLPLLCRVDLFQGDADARRRTPARSVEDVRRDRAQRSAILAPASRRSRNRPRGAP